MTEIKKALVLAALDMANIDEESLYDTYSGRGMIGAQCFGIVGSLRDFMQFFTAFIAEAEYDEDEFHARVELADHLAASVRSDSMGTDTIFYFPGFTLSE